MSSEQRSPLEHLALAAEVAARIAIASGAGPRRASGANRNTP